MSTFSNGSKVRFLPGPRSTTKITGTVTDTITSGEGRGKSTFLVVACDDGKSRKIRPGACAAA